MARARTLVRRSAIFVPADKLEKYLPKALDSAADSVIVDLEDSVSAPARPAARAAVAAMLRGDRAGKELVVRVSTLEAGPLAAECAAIFAEGGFPDALMVPKVRSRRCLDALAATLLPFEEAAGRSALPLIPIATELAEGLLNVREIAAHERVAAVTWGCEDLSVDIGATRKYVGFGDAKRYAPVFEYARLSTLLAAKAAGVQALDGVYTDVGNLGGLGLESRDAAGSGFDGKLALHPTQLAAINAAFTPSEATVARALKIVAAFAGCNASGVTLVDGEMVDMPHVRAAERVLKRCEAVKARDGTRGVQASPPPVRGKWFEELTVGLAIEHALTRTVTETDNVLATTLSLNPAALHLDHDAAAKTAYGRPLVNSMFTLSLLVGISVHETTHGTTVANLGFENVTFPAPVFHGDTLRATTTVVAARRSASRPTQGVVTFEHRAFNQHGVLVAKCTRSALMNCRPKAYGGNA